MIAVAPGAIASIMRLRLARKLSPLPLTLIAIHYAMQAALTLEEILQGNPARGTST